MIDMFGYLDYREYLRAYLARRQQASPLFSLRLFALKLGIDPSYLAKVLGNSRHLGEQYVAAFGRFEKLSGRQAAYFETLVHFSKARTDDQKQMFFEKLLSLRTVYAGRLEEYQYAFFTRWHYTALRNLLEFHSFHGDDFGALGAMLSPPITAVQAREGIDLLLKLGLIQLHESGRYVLTDSAISTGDAWRSLAVHAYQKETIQLSLEALDRHPREMRDVSTVTMNVTGEEFIRIREMIRQFRSQVISYVNGSEHPDRIYQLNVQLIPLSRLDTSAASAAPDADKENPQ